MPASPRSGQKLAIWVAVMSLIAGGVAGAVTGHLTGGGAPPLSETSGTTASGGTATTPGAAGDTNATGANPLAALPALVARISASVVALDVVGTPGEGEWPTTGGWAGSGFVLDAGGMIATNAHVVAGADRITVTLPGGATKDATVVASDAARDVAVIHVDRSDLVPLPMATEHELEVGDLVIAAGNALALEGSPTITVGIVSALDRDIVMPDGTTMTDLVQTDASISSGSSGGPLVSANGEVVGITTAGAVGSEDTSVENIGFAVPITLAGPVLLGLAAHGG